jgi:hypothetical protein
MRRTALIARLVSLAVFATVLGVAALLTVTTTPQVLADDAIDCSDPANAGAAECDPTSSITLTSSKDGQTVAPGATIDWKVTAICTGPQQQHCQAAGTSVGGPVPDGYIVRIIGPRNSCDQGATTPLVVEVTTLGGIATGTLTAPSSPGTYWYHAEHPAQQNLAGATWANAQSNCISITVASVSAGTSAISTQVHDANHNDITNSSVPLGSVVHDKATVTTTVNPIPAGSSVTFQFFNNGACSGTPVSTETTTLDGGSSSKSVESSATAPLAAGSYSYKAKFNSGDTSKVPDAESECEPFTVLKGTPTVATELHKADESVVASGGSVPLGTSMHDKATVSGIAAFTPTGSVTFTFYNNGSCDGAGTGAGTVALVAGVAHPSTAFGPLAAGSYSFKAHYNGDSNYNEADSPCEPFTVLKADPTVTTAIYLMPGHVVVTSVTMGATIHDDATVTGIAPFTPSGTVTFNLYRSNNCTGTVVQTSTGTLSGSGASATTESSPNYLTTAADIPALSFKASYSGDSNYNPKDSDCEPLTVLSSIVAFYYKVIDGTDAPRNPGTYDCTLPASEKGKSTDCPDGTTAASITKGITNTYRLHVVVANYTGVPITEKVQGGLTAAPGVQYSKLQVTCGNAKINVSKAGNVVVWDSVGDGKTNNPGFTMDPGEVCELTVEITVKFSGTGLQPLTSSWSEFQCLLEGPNAGFCEKSPYTNSLMVVVS